MDNNIFVWILTFVFVAFGFYGNWLDWSSSRVGIYYGGYETNNNFITEDKYGRFNAKTNAIRFIFPVLPFLLYLFIRSNREFIPMAIMIWNGIIGLVSFLHGKSNYKKYAKVVERRIVYLEKLKAHLDDPVNKPIPPLTIDTNKKSQRHFSTMFLYYSDLPFEEARANIERKHIATAQLNKADWNNHRKHEEIQEVVK